MKSLQDYSIEQIRKKVSKIARRRSLQFDDYDMNNYPIFTTHVDEQLEYWVTDSGDVVQSNGFEELTLGNILGESK